MLPRTLGSFGALLLLACTDPGRDTVAQVPEPARLEPARLEPARLDAARAAALELRALLEDYYGGPDVLEQTWYAGPDAPGQPEGLRFLADKMARAIVWGERFVVGAIGSSVTSGTGNCAYDTYPQQLQRTLAPVFEAAGAGFAVRNAGQGGGCGDSHRNQVFCLRALVGDDVDVVHYSWTYFEHGDSHALHETFYRWALAMERAPVPQLLYANTCERLSAGDAALLERYGRFGANVLCMTRGIARLGFSRGEPRSDWGRVGDGLHETTRYGEAVADPERRRSLGVVFRNWHPGPLLFQTTADAIAWRYTAALLVALDAVEREPRPAVRWPREPAPLARAVLPDPLACDPALCDVAAPPHCLYLEEPRFGESGVSPVGASEDPRTGQPVLSTPGWRFRRFATGHEMPEAEQYLPECAPATYCAGFAARRGEATEWLAFRLPRLETGHIQLCCAARNCGQKLLDAGTEFEVDGERLGDPRVSGKCVVLQERFGDPERARAESHEVRVRLPALRKPPPPISHVFGL